MGPDLAQIDPNVSAHDSDCRSAIPQQGSRSDVRPPRSPLAISNVYENAWPGAMQRRWFGILLLLTIVVAIAGCDASASTAAITSARSPRSENGVYSHDFGVVRPNSSNEFVFSIVNVTRQLSVS